MKWVRKSAYAKWEDRLIWRPWFAWYPVKMIGSGVDIAEYRWLETVRRRLYIDTSKTSYPYEYEPYH